MIQPDGTLSDEQISALAPPIRLIEAGPGAGKTRTVVARFRERVRDGKCVALLSFTNAAVDVARSRCRDNPSLVEPPNFLGTFDQFFHRYVLTPDTRRQHKISPKYVSSWDDLPEDLAIVRPPSGGLGFPLSRFIPDTAGQWILNEAQVGWKLRTSWNSLSPWTRSKINQSATQRIASLHNRYVFETNEARARSLALLQQPKSIWLSRLGQRFDEVIVDEFQDCDALEHQLLDMLRAAGIHVVTVADPDQAIYEFRQSSTGLYEAHRASLNSNEIARLTTCFRSSPAICSLTTALRILGQDPIVPYGDRAGDGDVVHVVVGSGQPAGHAALEIVRRHGIPPRQVRVIAHGRSAARSLVRSGDQPPGGVSQMERLLVAIAEIRSGVDARGRLRALARAETFVMDQFNWQGDCAPETRTEQLEALNLRLESVRVLISEISTSSHEWTDKQACTDKVRQVIKRFAQGLPLSLRDDFNRRTVVPDRVWKFWESRNAGMLTVTDADTVRWSHVHGVKGDEFDAVVLSITDSVGGQPHVLDDWQNNRSSELRRVLYVGASRARRVLVLVVPLARQGQLTELLRSAGVRNQVTVVTKSSRKPAVRSAV